MWVKLSPNRTDSCFPCLSLLKTHVKLLLNTVSLHWHKLKLKSFHNNMQYNITEEKKTKKKNRTKFGKTLLLKVQYPNWGQGVSVRITTTILHYLKRVKFPTSFMNFIRVRVHVCTCRLTTSNLVAGVLDTCWTHNCPFSVHSLS